MVLNVVKIGGAVLEDSRMRETFLKRFAALGGPAILVHGGGRTATDIAARLGVPTRMEGGRRVTDADMLEVVTMVYGGLVNKRTVAELQSLGVNAIGLSGADLGCVKAHKRPVGEIDYGFVGDVDGVDSRSLSMLLASGAVPVIAPLSFDPQAGLLNTNADTIATEVARAMASGEGPDGRHYDVTLTYCFEKKGVLADPEDDDSVIPSISREDYARMRESGIVSGGMIPKIDNAFSAIDGGVGKVVITGAMFLGEGCGTVICG